MAKALEAAMTTNEDALHGTDVQQITDIMGSDTPTLGTAKSGLHVLRPMYDFKVGDLSCIPISGANSQCLYRAILMSLNHLAGEEYIEDEVRLLELRSNIANLLPAHSLRVEPFLDDKSNIEDVALEIREGKAMGGGVDLIVVGYECSIQFVVHVIGAEEECIQLFGDPRSEIRVHLVYSGIHYDVIGESKDGRVNCVLQQDRDVGELIKRCREFAGSNLPSAIQLREKNKKFGKKKRLDGIQKLLGEVAVSKARTPPTDAKKQGGLVAVKGSPGVTLYLWGCEGKSGSVLARLSSLGINTGGVEIGDSVDGSPRPIKCVSRATADAFRQDVTTNLGKLNRQIKVTSNPTSKKNRKIGKSGFEDMARRMDVMQAQLNAANAAPGNVTPAPAPADKMLANPRKVVNDFAQRVDEAMQKGICKFEAAGVPCHFQVKGGCRRGCQLLSCRANKPVDRGRFKCLQAVEYNGEVQVWQEL